MSRSKILIILDYMDSANKYIYIVNLINDVKLITPFKVTEAGSGFHWQYR